MPRDKALNFLSHYGQLETGHGLLYKQIHIFADDHEILQAQSLSPDSCTYMNCWWLIGSRVAFVEWLSGGATGVWYKSRNDKIAPHEFTIVTFRSVIFREPFERTLKIIETTLRKRIKQFQKGRYIITNEDVYSKMTEI